MDDCGRDWRRPDIRSALYVLPVYCFDFPPGTDHRHLSAAFQARFSQPEDRLAIVVATNLFFRSFGGTIGLAQLSAVMYSRVRSYITDQYNSGNITGDQVFQITAALSSIESSSGGILSLPQQLQNVITSAFKDGIRWAFFSLLPWMGIAFVLSLFLSIIPEERMRAKPGQQQQQQQAVHEESAVHVDPMDENAEKK